MVVRPDAEATAFVELIRTKPHLDPAERRRLQRLTVSLMPNWIEHFRRRGQIKPLVEGQEDGMLVYEGDDYEAAIGLRIIDLPPETYVA